MRTIVIQFLGPEEPPSSAGRGGLDLGIGIFMLKGVVSRTGRRGPAPLAHHEHLTLPKTKDRDDSRLHPIPGTQGESKRRLSTELRSVINFRRPVWALVSHAISRCGVKLFDSLPEKTPCTWLPMIVEAVGKLVARLAHHGGHEGTLGVGPQDVVGSLQPSCTLVDTRITLRRKGIS